MEVFFLGLVCLFWSFVLLNGLVFVAPAVRSTLWATVQASDGGGGGGWFGFGLQPPVG